MKLGSNCYKFLIIDIHSPENNGTVKLSVIRSGSSNTIPTVAAIKAVAGKTKITAPANTYSKPTMLLSTVVLPVYGMLCFPNSLPAIGAKPSPNVTTAKVA
ncbi:MAG TPA: hypothetical protein VNI77_09965 [Nitrososphaera sp.]|nr:hypothetical protein [Nitrososphaera sp.]